MNLSPVKSTKAYEAIIERLRQEIVTGQIAPGSKLPSVRELSEQLSVSRPAVREALTALQAMKLITMRQGEGTFVNHYDPREITKSVDEWTLMSASDIQAILELRKVVETGSAKLAATRRTNENLADMNCAIAKMESDITSATLGDQADWELHYAIAQASQNPFLVALMDSISERIQTAVKFSRQALYQLAGEPEQLLTQHKQIITCIANGDGAAAAVSMVNHLSHVEMALARVHCNPTPKPSDEIQ